MGALVGDAACMPAHWNYDRQKLLEILGEKKDTPEYFETPSCPFYGPKDFPGHYSTGQLSPYGEQIFGMLSLVSALPEGPLQGPEFAVSFQQWFSSYKGRVDHATKDFLQKMEEGKTYPDCGADDNQGQCFGKVPLAVGKWKSSSDMEKNLEVMVTAHQNHDMARDCALVVARLLQIIVDTDGFVTVGEAWSKLKEASGVPPSLSDAVTRVEASLSKPTHEMLLEYGEETAPGKAFMGLSCANPQAFMGVLHAALNATSFESGVRATLLAGGDNCSRATAVGALLGAVYGVPEEWKAKFAQRGEVEGLLGKL